MVLNYVTISLALSSGQNPAALTSLYALQSVFTAVLFYVLFGEKLQKGHFVGIFFFLVSVFMISAGAS